MAAIAGTFALRDPLQGYDIRVRSVAATGDGKGRLVGAFNTFMWRIINQTEAYIALNQRVPRMLDGEVIAVWSLEQGMISIDVVANTFGDSVATTFSKGRNNIIPRQLRMGLVVEAGIGTTINTPTDTSGWFGQAGFNLDGGDKPNLAVKLKYARVDTLTFGVAPGKAVAGNSWQGTAEGVDDGST